MKLNSLICNTLLAAIVLNVSFLNEQSFAQSGGWSNYKKPEGNVVYGVQQKFTAKNGMEVTITYGDFSRGRDPNGPGYEGYTVDTPKEPEIETLYGYLVTPKLNIAGRRVSIEFSFSKDTVLSPGRNNKDLIYVPLHVLTQWTSIKGTKPSWKSLIEKDGEVAINDIIERFKIVADSVISSTVRRPVPSKEELDSITQNINAKIRASMEFGIPMLEYLEEVQENISYVKPKFEAGLDRLSSVAGNPFNDLVISMKERTDKVTLKTFVSLNSKTFRKLLLEQPEFVRLLVNSLSLFYSNLGTGVDLGKAKRLRIPIYHEAIELASKSLITSGELTRNELESAKTKLAPLLFTLIKGDIVANNGDFLTEAKSTTGIRHGVYDKLISFESVDADLGKWMSVNACDLKLSAY